MKETFFCVVAAFFVVQVSHVTLDYTLQYTKKKKKKKEKKRKGKKENKRKEKERNNRSPRIFHDNFKFVAV